MLRSGDLAEALRRRWKLGLELAPSSRKPGQSVAQFSATPASVAATPPVARHLFRGSLTCDTPGSSRATGATGPFRGGV